MKRLIKNAIRDGYAEIIVVNIVICVPVIILAIVYPLT